MATYLLTELQYSNDRKGPWRAYIYRADGLGYECRFYFGRDGYAGLKSIPNEFSFGKIHVVLAEFEEGISVELAKKVLDRAKREKREVRVTDCGDMLVFHVKDGHVLYGETFWQEIS